MKITFGLLLSLSLLLVGCAKGRDLGSPNPAAKVDPLMVAATLPSCDQANATAQSKKDTSALIDKETTRINGQMTKIQAESDQIDADFNNGKITQDAADAKRTALKARLKVLLDQQTAIAYLSNCLQKH